MPVDPNHKHADVPHEKTVMAKGWTYGCHSSKTGDKPRGRPSSYMVRDGYLRVTGTPAFREHTTHWLDKDHEGNPLKCGHMKKFRLLDPQCIGCANRD
jgi:hypothetical protein